MNCYRQALMVAAAGFSVALTQAGFAAPFTNGSFEEPVLLTDGDSGADPTVTPWVLSNGTDDIRHYRGDFFGGPDPQDADQFVGFTSYGADDGGVLSQSFDTVIGETYGVSFWVNNADFDPINDPTAHQLVAAVDNTGGDSAVALPTESNEWQSVGFNFVASATTTTLSFTSAINSGPSASADILLDNVNIAVVPEPGSLALLGLGGLFMARRRR